MTKSLTARLAAEAEDLRQAAHRAEHAAARLAKFKTDFAAAKAAGVVSNIAPNGAKAFKAARAAMQAEEDVWRDMLVSDADLAAKQVVRTPSAPNPRRVIEKTYTPKGMACPGPTEGIRRVQAALRALQAEARTTGIPASQEARFALYAEYDRERAAYHEAVVARKEARHD